MFKVVETPALKRSGDSYLRNRELYLCDTFINHFWDMTPAEIILRLSPRASAESVEIILSHEPNSYVTWGPAGDYPAGLYFSGHMLNTVEAWLTHNGVAPKEGGKPVTVHITLFVVE